MTDDTDDSSDDYSATSAYSSSSIYDKKATGSKARIFNPNPRVVCIVKNETGYIVQ